MDAEAKEKQITWDIVEEQMSINKQARISWPKIFGCTLTKLVARLKAQGMNSTQAYSHIIATYPMHVELQRRVKIGVAARFGEMASEQAELNKHKTSVM